MRDEGILVDPESVADFRERAVLYLLRRMRVDVNFRHYMLGTEAFELLCIAEAERQLTSVDAVKALYSKMHEMNAHDVADVVKLREKLEKIRQTCEKHPTIPGRVVEEIERILAE
jgi:hypothetical protein